MSRENLMAPRWGTNLRHLTAAAAVVGWMITGPVANAATALTLVDVLPGQEIKQTNTPPDDPCVIGDSSCTNNQPAGMDWEIIDNADVTAGEWNLQSPTYTIGFLESVLLGGGSLVTVGIDVNKTGNSTETLDYFEVWIEGALEYFFGTDDNNAGGTDPDLADAVDLRNGTGFSDRRLNIIDLSLWNDTDEIYFKAGLDGVGDGQEQFFLSNDLDDPPLIPLPAALPLFITALGGMGLLSRRRKRKAAA